VQKERRSVMTSSLIRSERTERGLERPALASGIRFVAVQIATLAFTAVFFATTHPPMDASPQEAARGFAQAQAMVEIGTFPYVLQILFLLVFLGGLFSVLDGDVGSPGKEHASFAGTCPRCSRGRDRA
jgi:hypothetical protein